MPNPETDPEDREFRQMQYDNAAWFMDKYGVPLSAARQMSKWDNPTGKHWKGVLEYLGDEKPIMGMPGWPCLDGMQEGNGHSTRPISTNENDKMPS